MHEDSSAGPLSSSPSSPPAEPPAFRIGLQGPPGSGKTSLAQRFLHDRFLASVSALDSGSTVSGLDSGSTTAPASHSAFASAARAPGERPGIRVGRRRVCLPARPDPIPVDLYIWDPRGGWSAEDSAGGSPLARFMAEACHARVTVSRLPESRDPSDSASPASPAPSDLRKVSALDLGLAGAGVSAATGAGVDRLFRGLAATLLIRSAPELAARLDARMAARPFEPEDPDRPPDAALAARVAELSGQVAAQEGFISAASHELRAPLASMLAYLELLMDPDFGRLDAEQLANMEVVRAGAARLHGLTDNLVDLARLDAGQMDLLLEACPLAPILEAAIAAQRAEYLDRNLNLSLDPRPEPSRGAGMSDELPLVLCEPARLRKVLDILLDNARDYSTGGGLAVSLRQAPDGRSLTLDLADRGLGIRPEERGRLFTPFFRGEDALVTGAPGAGLGLCLARSLMRMQGGDLEYAPRDGGGSRFSIRLRSRFA